MWSSRTDAFSDDVDENISCQDINHPQLSGANQQDEKHVKNIMSPLLFPPRQAIKRTREDRGTQKRGFAGSESELACP